MGELGSGIARSSDDLKLKLEELFHEADQFTAKSVDRAVVDKETAIFWMLAGTCLSIVLGLLGSWFISRAIVRPLRQMSTVLTMLERGERAEIPCLARKDELGVLAGALQQMQITAIETARIKAALDNAASNMMVADNDFNIVYLNRAVIEMLRRAEADVRKDLPNSTPPG